MDSDVAAKEAIQAFSKALGKDKFEISAIIITHYAQDTVGGLKEFKKFAPNAPVYMHEAAKEFISIDEKQCSAERAFQWRKSWFEGKHLNQGEKSDEKRINLRDIQNIQFFNESNYHLKICGNFDLHLIHAPSTYDEHCIVSFPLKKMVYSGTLIAKGFPILFPFCGERKSKDPMGFVGSLKKILDFSPSVVIPCYSQDEPLTGQTSVMKTVSTYISAIQVIYDQSIRFINKGMTPDEMVEHVYLPYFLEDHPYLQVTVHSAYS